MAKVRILSCWLVAVLFVLNGALGAAETPSIIRAVKHGDLAEMRALIKAEVDVNAPQADGATALHWAVHRDDIELAKLLIRAGAEVDATNDFGIKPIWLAFENKNADIVGLLLKAGADPNSLMLTGESLLMTAAHYGSVDVVRLLLDAGADVNVTEPVRGQTPLMWAIDENRTDAALLLLEAGSDIHAKTTFGFTPLMFASRNGETEVAEALLDAGADVNGISKFMGTNLYQRDGVTEENKDNPGYSVLQLAVHRGHGDTVVLLLERGADPNYDKLGFTALLWACGSWESTLDGAFGINAPKDSEWYHMGGLRDDKYQIIEALLKHGANPDARLKDHPTRFGFAPRARPIGSTPYVLAAIAAHADTMRMLVEYDADPALVPDNKVPALLFAAGAQRLLVNSLATEEGSIEAVQAALDLGAKITDTDAQGNTVLHGAAKVKSPNLIQFLFDQGADVLAKNAKGDTPEDEAYRFLRGVSGGAKERSSPTLDLIRELSKPVTLMQAMEEWGEMEPHIREAVEALLNGELERISEAATAKVNKE